MGQSNVVIADELVGKGLTDLGVQYVINVCESPPARRVGKVRNRNLTLDVPMPRLGVSLQAESLSGEFLFLVSLNQRSDLLAVYDQPVSITVQITDSSGRRTRGNYTGDYLVVDQRKVIMYEVKPDHVLEELVRTRPVDWVVDGERYRYLAAEALLTDLGIDHVVVPTSKLSPVRADNLRLIQAARRCEETKRLRRQRGRVRELVTLENAARADDIMKRLELDDATAILQLIDRGEIFAAIDEVLLCDFDHIWLCDNQSAADALQRSEKQLLAILRSNPELKPGEWLDSRYHEDVLCRLAIAKGLSTRDRHGKEVSASTIQRIKKAFRESGGDPGALEPHWGLCGNRESRISETHRAFLIQSIRGCRGDRSDPTPRAGYLEYVLNFPEFRRQTGLRSENPVSRSTYYRRWHSIPFRSDDAAAKGGRRLANAISDAFDPNGKTITASRKFVCAHIDHYKADFFVVIGEVKGKKITARPWITAMVDAHSKEVLSLWMSLLNPSKKACSMVVRDCVRRHGRLPEMVVVDGGAEFDSLDFALLLATCRVIRAGRPPEDPRYGQEVERLFKTFKESFAQGLPGYGLSIAQARKVSAAFKADKNAVLAMQQAFELLEAFAFRGYNQSQLPESPIGTRAEIGQRSVRKFPFSGMPVEWDLKFMIASSVEAPSASYRLYPGQGIDVNRRWYSSPALQRFAGFKKDVRVRIEPYDTSVVYVCVDGGWLTCSHTSRATHAHMVDDALIALSRDNTELSALKKELANVHAMESAALISKLLNKLARARSVAKDLPKIEEDLGREFPEDQGEYEALEEVHEWQ